MNILERILYEQPGGMLREYEGLTTHFQPKDPSLYRKLLPGQFAMPAHPVVTIFVIDYLRNKVGPMTGYRYQEWSVALKSQWNGEEGWFPLTMPVTRPGAMKGGVYLGFPKYVADEITLTRSGETRLATGKYKDVTQLALEYCPGITRPLALWEKELLENESFFKGDFHLLVPPGKGPRAQKVILRHVIQPKWSPEKGMIRVRVDPSESWAGLVPDVGEFPGTYNHFLGGFNLIAERFI